MQKNDTMPKSDKNNRGGRPLKYGEPSRGYVIRLPISLWKRIDKLTHAAVYSDLPEIIVPMNASDVIKQALEYLLPLAEAALEKEKRKNQNDRAT